MSKNLTLSIKQEFFDKILAGTKKIESREIRPNSNTKYCEVDKDGYILTYEDDSIIPRHYDAITFLTGAYTGTRPRMVVEVKGAEIFEVEDENGDLISYEHEGETYNTAFIDYHLGEILEKP